MPGKFRLVALLLLGLGLSLLGFAFLSNPSAGPKPAQTPAQVTVPVVVAKNPVVFGEPITADLLAVEQMNAKPEGAFSDPKELIGRIPVLSAGSGVVLNEAFFVNNSISASVRPGYRAVSLKIDEGSSATAKLKAGDFVDLFALFRKDDREVSNTQSRLIVSRLRVLSVGNQIIGKPEPENKDPAQQQAQLNLRAVVVEVGIKDVNAALIAQQQGTLVVAVRNPEDDGLPMTADFPAPALLNKKKVTPGQTPPVNSPEDEAYAGLGLSAGVAAGPVPKTTGATGATQAPMQGFGNNPDNNSRSGGTVEVIRRGTTKNERAQ